ncbi:MAG: nucleotidyltransferase family protein [Clostridiales bacterium]|nr:nucleotidyltransferase family protein [Clostridiales bacterium]
MKIIGIIAEYNPFHNGHMYHIEESRKSVSEDTAVVCVMSGDFVQRGEAAIFSKYARAEAAVMCGADLVLELPLPWAISSAEKFSEGAVGLLDALGCIDYISFGSECGDLEILSKISSSLLNPSVHASIADELKTGISYASARQNAAAKQIGELAKYLSTPNNILAVEYLKALQNLASGIKPITVRRFGAGHDEEGGSASSIRGMIAAGKSISAYVPHRAMEVYARETEQGRGPVTMSSLECAILSRLRMLKESDFASLPDYAEGLSNRIYSAARTETSLESIYSSVKTKRYALSRIRRMCISAALGIKAGDTDGIPPFARILALNEKGRNVAKIISEKSSIPVIAKPAAVRRQPCECQRIFELGSAAHDLYVLGYRSLSEHRGDADWRESPRIIK